MIYYNVIEYCDFRSVVNLLEIVSAFMFVDFILDDSFSRGKSYINSILPYRASYIKRHAMHVLLISQYQRKLMLSVRNQLTMYDIGVSNYFVLAPTDLFLGSVLLLLVDNHELLEQSR